MQFHALPTSLLYLSLLTFTAASTLPLSSNNELAPRSPNPLDIDLGLVDVSLCSCPPVWKQVIADLKSTFAGCTDPARASIRTSFHDCFPSSCDGSLILANECSDRPENAQMIPACQFLGGKAEQYGVGVADLIQGAAALGITACGGPKISFKTGRKDSSTPSPQNQLPSGTSNAQTQVAAFLSRGFSALELVALVGAHSAGKNLAGQALDSTVGQLDVRFYSETQDGTAPASLDSDRFLSNTTGTDALWKGMAGSQGGWSAAFGPAMEKMAVIGVNALLLTDCSSLL